MAASKLEKIVSRRRGLSTPPAIKQGRAVALTGIPDGFKIMATKQSEALAVVQLVKVSGEVVATLTGRPDNVRAIGRRLLKVYF